LPMLTPRGLSAPEQGHLAYRAVAGLEAVRGEFRGITGIRMADFAPFWGAGRPGTGLSYAASYVRRPADPPPVLPPRPRPLARLTAMSQDLTLRVGAQGVRVQAVFGLEAPNRDVPYAEWDLVAPAAQSLQVIAVTGPEVLSWFQTGNRLGVWFDRPFDATRVEVQAVQQLVLARGGQPAHFDPPALRLAGATPPTPQQARPAAPTVRLVAAPGQGVQPTRLVNLAPATEPSPAQPGRLFTVTQPTANYSGTVQVVPQTAQARASVLTFVESRDG